MISNLLAEVSWTNVLYAFLITAGVAIVFAVLILIVAKLFAVKEDDRLKAIMQNLSGADCGGCGFPGCKGCASAMLEGKAGINACSKTGETERRNIAEIVGVEYADSDEQVAVVCCNGGEKCNDKFNYLGYGDCSAREFMLGGSKQCEKGCLGSFTCGRNCPDNAIKIENGVAKVSAELCEGCGKCTLVCPKKLIKRIPKRAKFYVACSSACKGKDVMAMCENGCIGCGMCARVCENGAIQMVDNLPVFDYDKCINCGKCHDKCPRKCIKYVHG